MTKKEEPVGEVPCQNVHVYWMTVSCNEGLSKRTTSRRCSERSSDSWGGTVGPPVGDAWRGATGDNASMMFVEQYEKEKARL